jgi:hypothetical protein
VQCWCAVGSEGASQADVLGESTLPLLPSAGPSNHLTAGQGSIICSVGWRPLPRLPLQTATSAAAPALPRWAYPAQPERGPEPRDRRPCGPWLMRLGSLPVLAGSAAAHLTG